MKRFGFILVLWVFAAALPSSALAFDPRYPDWPCVQAKVPELSVGAMWDGPSIADVGNSWRDDPKTRDLVPRLAARRTALEAAEKAIGEFMAGGSETEKQRQGTKLFAGLFDTLSQERREVMNGIERVSRNEKDLGEKIRSDVTTLHQLEDKPDEDQTKVTQLASQVEWSTRIFEDRRKTIRYVCEVPTTIEQRLFALARAIRQNMD
jgi:hypothetical protein